MTDLSAPPPRDPDELDQLASALVDGLLPPEEAARAQQDPEIRARVDQIHNTRAALHATPPPDPRATEAAITAALAAFDAELAADSAPPPPIPLRQPGAPGQSPPHGWPAPQNAGRRGRSPRPWLAAAAAILVAVLAIGLLTRNDNEDADLASRESSDQPTAADQSQESAEESTGDGDAGGSATPNQESAPSDRTETDAEVATTIPDLGNVPTVEEIATRVRTSLDAGVSPPPEEAAGLDEGVPCDQLTVAGDPARGASTYVADASLADNPVRIHVYETPQGQQMVVTDRDTCTTVADQPLEP